MSGIKSGFSRSVRTLFGKKKYSLPKVPKFKVTKSLQKLSYKLDQANEELKKLISSKTLNKSSEAMALKFMQKIKKFTEIEAFSGNKTRMMSSKNKLISPSDFSIWLISTSEDLLIDINLFKKSVEV